MTSHSDKETAEAQLFRVQRRYDELMREGRHGHYETLFRVVREEADLSRNEALEEAAKAVEQAELDWDQSAQAQFAAAIRALQCMGNI